MQCQILPTKDKLAGCYTVQVAGTSYSHINGHFMLLQLTETAQIAFIKILYLKK